MATIIDLTRARPGTEQRLLERVLADTPGAEDAPLEIRAYLSQQPSLAATVNARGLRLEAMPDTTPGTELVAGISNTIQVMLKEPTSVRVYSFNPAVKQMVSTWSGVHGDRVAFVPLAQFARVDAPRVSWDETFMPEDEAALAVAAALAARPGQKAFKTDLRPLLETFDARFSKESGGFAASPGFISRALELAVIRGFVITSGDDDSRFAVVLTDAGRRAVGMTNDRSAANRGGTATEPTRSQRFLDSWRRANLGPFMEVRTDVYDHIQSNLTAEGQELKRLVSGGVRAVREAGTDRADDYPWSRVTQFIEELMRRRPVALSEGRPISLSWTTGRCKVTEMAEDWPLLLDGQLVLHLIDDGFELRIGDLPDLAGALYNGRWEDNVERAFDVVQRLADDGLIVADSPDRPLVRPAMEPSLEPQAEDGGTEPERRELRLAPETPPQEEASEASSDPDDDAGSQLGA